MKLVLVLAYIQVIVLIKYVQGSAIQAPLEVISYDDISPEDRKELEYIKNKLGRPKRSGSGSGSGDILESLKAAIGQGIKNKIGEIAKGSAAASARLSSSSSGWSSGHGHSYHHSYHPHPHPPETYDHKSLDFWTLKKSILNTLLQAVKAIKGGVIAVKGQLIKGSGYLTSATGKLIVAKGDAVTNLGKKIASSAILVPYHGHSSSGHAEYGPPPESHFSAPSAPEDFYHGSPSAPAPEIHDSGHHHAYHDDETYHKGASGLLILKKIHGDHHHLSTDSEVPAFKPISHPGPSFGTIVGKFLSASSSVDPHKPEPFGHTAGADIHPYEELDSKNHHEVAPSASGYVIDDESPSDKEIIKPSSDAYSFEKEPSYLSHNFDEYISSPSKKSPQTANANSITHDGQRPEKDYGAGSHSEPSKPTTSAQIFSQSVHEYPSNVHNLGTAPSNIKGTNDLYNLPNLGDYPSGFLGPSSDDLIMIQSSQGELPAALLGQTSTGQNIYSSQSQSSSVIDLTRDYGQPSFDGSAQGQSYFSGEVPTYSHPIKINPNSKIPKQHSHSPTSHVNRRPTRLTAYDSSHSSSRYRSKTTRPKHSSSVIRKKPPSGSIRTSTTTNHKPKQTYDVVKSVAYQLGPNGPKRLT